MCKETLIAPSLCAFHMQSSVPLGLLFSVGSTVGISPLSCAFTVVMNCYSARSPALPYQVTHGEDPRALSEVTEGEENLEKHTAHPGPHGWLSIKSIRPACSVIIQGRSSHPQLHFLSPPLQSTWEPRGSRGAVQEELQRSAFPPLIPMFRGLRAKLGFPIPAVSMVHWRKGLFSEKLVFTSQLT